MKPILSQQDLDELYKRICQDGVGEDLPNGPHRPLIFDSTQSEDNFRRLILGQDSKEKP